MLLTGKTSRIAFGAVHQAELRAAQAAGAGSEAAGSLTLRVTGRHKAGPYGFY